jgi:chemotaxis protein methyltransferase CheR
VNIWSAGCSSGEEPYTVLMLAREAGLEPGRDIHVYASDISRRVLHKARRGVYRDASFRDTEGYYREKYFVEKDGSYWIRDELKRQVDFIHLNLVDRPMLAILGTMDVILCRNVIIYFDAETKRKVVGTFHDKLHPGGYLLMGHSESLLNLSNDFELRHLTNDMVYRRPAPGEEPTDRWHRAAAAAIGRIDPDQGEAS